MIGLEDSGPSAIPGWDCTPSDGPPQTLRISSAGNTNKGCLARMFISGWRRTALYGIIVVLMSLVFLNIALTLWIVGALKLSTNGIGPIRIVRGGIQIDGRTWIVDNFIASSITSQIGQPIILHSYRNFTVKVGEPDSVGYSRLFIKRDNIEFRGRSLHVRDARGASVFQAARDEVRVFADALAVDGPGGVNVRNAVQTPHIYAPPAANLTLESLTRRLELRAPQSIFLESRAGSIDITSHSNIKLNSGTIQINAANIVIKNLREGITTNKPQRNIKRTKVYQLCACGSGKLFLATPEAPCTAHDEDTDLCR